MTDIHPTAVVAPGAELADDAVVGPFCVVEDNVVIGSGTVLESHCVVKSGVILGTGCQLSPGVCLGGLPQDLKYQGEDTKLILGDGNILRECVSIHRATGEGNATVIGSHNMIMAYSHVGHNCQLGDNIMLASYVGVSGHVVVEDKVVIGGITGIHQFVRIGKLVMIGGQSRVVRDVPPFMKCVGYDSKVVDLNVVGLRRNNVDQAARIQLKRAYRLLYREGLNTSQALQRIAAEVEPGPEVNYLVDFIMRVREGTAGRQQQH